MAYTDFTFYGTGYFGDTLTEETAPKWLERASDELDAITFWHLPRRKRRTEAITGLSRLSRPDGNPFPIRRVARTAPFTLPPQQAQRHKQL